MNTSFTAMPPATRISCRRKLRNGAFNGLFCRWARNNASSAACANASLMHRLLASAVRT